MLNTDTTPRLHLRGGSLADSYGYSPNFARRAHFESLHGRSRSRSSRTRSRFPQAGRDPYAAPGREYDADESHNKRARTSLGFSPDHRARPAEDDAEPRRSWLSWALLPAGSSGRRQRGQDELASGGWRPTRMAFDVRWPEDEFESEWFERVYAHLYVRVREFVAEYFGYGDVPAGRAGGAPGGGELWLRAGLSKQFLWFVEQVAMQDNNVGGWDDLLAKRLFRECLVTGVVGKVLETSVFDDLLFGADKTQKDMLEAQDRCTLELDGYQRTKLRSQCVRTMLGDAMLPPEFWPCVDRLSLQFAALLLPLVRIMDESFPASQAKSLRNIHQDLHAIVAEAAYLSVGIRWSSDIFRFSFPYPGEPWDLDQDHVDGAVYKASEAARDMADKLDEERWRAERVRKQQSVPESRPSRSIIGNQAGTLIASARSRLETLRKRVLRRGHEEETDGGKVITAFYAPSRLAKVQIALWPMLQRFALAGDIDPETGVADGEHVTTILNSQVVYYCGRPSERDDDPNEHYPTLIDWMHEGKRKRVRNILFPLRWLAYAAGLWLFLSFLARYSSVVDDILQVVRHGLAAVAKYIAREVLLFVMEVLITGIAIAIGVVKVGMFMAYAVRNALDRVLSPGLRLLWSVFGGKTDGWFASAPTYPELSWQSMKDAAISLAGTWHGGR